MVSVERSSRSIWTSSRSGTTVGGQPTAAFQTLLGLGTGRAPTPYQQIRGARDDGGRQWLIATYWGQLKQPDKQEPPTLLLEFVSGTCEPFRRDILTPYAQPFLCRCARRVYGERVC